MSGGETAPDASASTSRRRVPLIVALPVILLIPFLGLLFLKLSVNMRSSDPSQLPSALIGKPVPQFDLPAIPRILSDFGPVPGLSSAALSKGRVSLLNVWASWCTPCIAEHPQLVELGRQGIPLYSINYKDKPEAARRFLAQHGNPYRAIGADNNGLTAIDFGVYGVPETFVIDGGGRIAYRYPGPLTPEIVAEKIMPAIRKAEREGARLRS